MKKFTTILALTFAVALGACGNPSLENPNPQLNICDGDQVDDLVLNVTQGSGTVRITQVTYENDKAFNTSIEFEVSMGDVVTVPYCNKQNVGDVRFQIQVAPSGPGVLYGYEYSMEIYYEVMSEHKDIRIWDANGFENFGSGYAGVASHTDGEFESYNVAIEPWVW
ncbi:hypothetical protein ACFL3T_00575 [Patescibacteria group bacterium]